MASSPRSSSCEPRWATARTPGRKTIGPRLAAISERLGRPPMEWQRRVFDVIGEVVIDDETGIAVPAYPEAMLSIMRQQGKTSVAEAWIWDRAVVWEAWDRKPQAVVYTAQKGSDGRNKFKRDMLPTWKRSPLWRQVERAYFAADNTGLAFKNQSYLSVMNTSESAGHGLVIDAAFMDEVFADQDNRREQTLVPAMATRHDRQKLIASAAGDQKSIFWNQKMANGRAAVGSGRSEGVAYFEWSADPKDPSYDPESPTTWHKCMPALGVTITERMVRQAFDEMLADPESGGVSEFERAWLNIPKTESVDRAIPAALWESALSDAEPAAPLVFGVDASLDQSWSTISVAGANGVVEPVERLPGTGWVLERAALLARRHSARLAIGAAGPLAHLIPDFKRQGVPLVELSYAEVAQACSLFLERLVDRRMSVRRVVGELGGALDDAAASALKKQSGDLWVWSRAVGDVSPLMSCTLAFSVASRPVGLFAAVL